VATTTAHVSTGGAVAGPPGAPRPPGRAGGRLRTPGRLWAGLTAAVLALLAVGTASAVTMAGRQATETRAVNSYEHLVVNVDELYHSLADADAAAATALLAGPVSPTRLTTQYATDVTQSENALAEASRDLAGDDQASARLAKVAAQLPTYTALVATAQANNRLGYPVGAAYLREASSFLRGTVLPEVKAVADEEAAAHNAAQASVSGAPVWLVVVAVLAALALAAVWRALSLATRRSVNLGLAAGALLAAAVLAWAVVATVSAVGSANSAQARFTAVTNALQGRDQVALAESFQALTLIDRGEDGGADAKGQAAALGWFDKDAVLDQNASTLLTALKAQLSSVAKAVERGDYRGAVGLTAGLGAAADPNTVAAKAAALDSALVGLYDADQKAYTADANSAAGAFSGGLWGALIGGLAAAAAAAYGVNRRLAEYR
jgi:hypothetical protein